MTVEYLDLADFVAISAAVTGLDEDTIVKVADLGLADSALHAPSASFGDREFYEDFIDKAAVLVVRSRAIIRCPTATSAPRGYRCECSST